MKSFCHSKLKSNFDNLCNLVQFHKKYLENSQKIETSKEDWPLTNFPPRTQRSDYIFVYWENLIKKIKIFSLSWNLVQLIRIWRIHLRCSIFLFSVGFFCFLFFCFEICFKKSSLFVEAEVYEFEYVDFDSTFFFSFLF